MSALQPDRFPATGPPTTFCQRITSLRWRWTVFLTGGSVLVFIAWLGFGKTPTSVFDTSRHSVPLEQIVDGGPGKDGIPAILRPQFVRASEASFLADRDRVLGLAQGSEIKAYPVKILTWHEIVNDTINGRRVMVTYCPLCGSGLAFDATVRGRPHTFGVSGLLYQSNVLLYDHQTESLWSQLGMKAVTGPLMGEKLTPMPLEHITWGEWRAAHPGTLVLSTQTGSWRNYDRDPYEGYEDTREIFFDVSHYDARYHPKEWVIGVERNGIAKAYPFTELQKTESPLHDRIGTDAIIVRFDLQHRSASVTDAQGQPVPSVKTYWFAWHTFHPDSELFAPASP